MELQYKTGCWLKTWLFTIAGAHQKTEGIFSFGDDEKDIGSWLMFCFLDRNEHICIGGSQSLSFHIFSPAYLTDTSLALLLAIISESSCISLSPHRNGGCHIHLLPWCLTYCGFLCGLNRQITLKENEGGFSWCQLQAVGLCSVTSIRLGSSQWSKRNNSHSKEREQHLQMSGKLSLWFEPQVKRMMARITSLPLNLLDIRDD